MLRQLYVDIRISPLETLMASDNESGNEAPRANMNPPVRTMRDYLQPLRTTSNSCIVLPANPLGTFSLKQGMLQHIPSFYGMDSKNPYLHLKDFEKVCSTFREPNTKEEVMGFKLFPFSLKEKGKFWLNAQQLHSIRSWQKL